MDPVLFEVLKHKIWALVDEQALSLRAASGSPVVTESNDFNVGLYLPDGMAAALGRYILTQAFTTGSIIKSIVADYAENPGWGPGDDAWSRARIASEELGRRDQPEAAGRAGPAALPTDGDAADGDEAARPPLQQAALVACQQAAGSVGA